MELCGDWAAWHDRMPGGPATLHVSGCCCFPTDGWSVEARQGRFGINPDIVMLELVVTPPESVAPDVLTEQDVRWSQETDGHYTQVHVRVLGAEAEGKVLDVQEVS